MSSGFQMGPIQVRYTRYIQMAIMRYNDSFIWNAYAGHCKGGGMHRPSSGEAAHSRGQHGGHDVLPHHDEARDGGAAEES